MLEAILDIAAVPGQSPIHHLWAGTKILAVVALGLGLVFAGRLWSFGAALLLLLIATALARVAPSLLWRTLRPLVILLTIGGLVVACTLDGKPLVHVGFIVVSQKGIDVAIRGSGLLGLLAFAAAIVNRTTEPAESVAAIGVLVHPLRRLRLPVDESLTMLAISLRFLPILAEEVTRLRQAQATRGLSAGEGSLENRLRAIESWVTTLLQANLRRAADLGEAMDARGYGDSGAAPFPLRLPKVRAGDVIGLVGVVALATAMIGLR